MATTRPTRQNPLAPPEGVLALSDQGFNSTQIAEHFGVSRQRISQILQANGVSPRDKQEVRRAASRRQYQKLKAQRTLERQNRRLQKQARRLQIIQLATELGVAPYTLSQFADGSGAYTKATTRKVKRINNILPNRFSPEGELLATRVKAMAAPWSPRHLIQNREKDAW